MSTHRSASLGPDPDPRTPPQFVPKRTVSTEPKSDYLRGVLESRRPKGTLTPSPAPPMVAESPSDSDDEWAPSDEHGKGQTLKRQLRRLSMDAPVDAKTPHRQKTRAELAKDKDKMEKNSFAIGLRIVLLEEQNAKYANELEEARERLEELEDVKEDNRELRMERDLMKLRLQNVDTLLAGKDDDIAELTAINDETIKEMEKRDAGLEEAADMILSLEEENTTLRQQLETSRLATVVNNSDYSSFDGEKMLTTRTSLASIAESKMSSSENHSDYYSQPGSPQVKPSKTPSPKKPARPASSRIQNMIYNNSKGHGSVNELRKRISYVSLTDRESVQSAPDYAPSAISTVPSLPDIKPPGTRRPINRAEPHLNTSVSAETIQQERSPRKSSLYPNPLALRDRFYKDQTASRIPQSPTTTRRDSGIPTPVLEQDAYKAMVPPRGSSKAFARRNSSVDQDPAESSPDLPQSSSQSSPESTETGFTQPHQQNWWEGYQRFTAKQNPTLPRPAVTRTNTAPNLFNPGEDEEEFMERMKGVAGRRR
ncbi:hypothetical protein BU16DRAFT_568361 [Lophium mytilinum]|uniref:Centrosomin N-terminal motif 1 domain-containing protein n=1 Tax=Lophium mytilinum TaxID=390894 RepID=A0A6A6Q846_9PEZI|nr:hypothetical protein BU16DRAFT_568361 [Lophium mytilinum]